MEIKMQIEGLIIDPQVDFCLTRGALYVNGAEQDITRLTNFVKRTTLKVNSWHVTLDSHHEMDIAHPGWWKDSKGAKPAPFSVLTADAVKNGDWTTTIPSLLKYSIEYLEKLEASGRYPHVIWPEHCLIGSEGQSIVPELREALKEYASTRHGWVDYITKGSNPKTEHFSAVRAEVPDPADPSTQINTSLIQTLLKADLVLIAGEAGSHCVANTVKDIADEFGDDSFVKKIVLLEDCVSPVTGFESYQDQFIKDLTARGMQLAKSTDFLS